MLQTILALALPRDDCDFINGIVLRKPWKMNHSNSWYRSPIVTVHLVSVRSFSTPSPLYQFQAPYFRAVILNSGFQNYMRLSSILCAALINAVKITTIFVQIPAKW